MTDRGNKIWCLVLLAFMVLVGACAIISYNLHRNNEGVRIFDITVKKFDEIVTKIDCHHFSLTNRYYELFTDTGASIDDGYVGPGMEFNIKAKPIEAEDTAEIQPEIGKDGDL